MLSATGSFGVPCPFRGRNLLSALSRRLFRLCFLWLRQLGARYPEGIFGSEYELVGRDVQGLAQQPDIAHAGQCVSTSYAISVGREMPFSSCSATAVSPAPFLALANSTSNCGAVPFLASCLVFLGIGGCYGCWIRVHPPEQSAHVLCLLTQSTAEWREF